MVTTKDVNRELEKFLPKKITKKWVNNALGRPEFGFDFPSAQASIINPVWDFLSRGGKRWRPALMLLACESSGGNPRDALPFTVLPELIHNGTIMVDDIEDNSTLRRGRPSTHLVFGTDIAINAGNSMYYLPFVRVFRNPKIPAKTKAIIYDLYAEEMLRLSFGQALDIHWHNGHNNNVTEKQYLEMCSYKTASLARFAIQAGAVLGGASKKQLKAFRDFATSIGVAFQIQDDILNVNPGKGWGKAIGDDIVEGKRTLLVIRALSRLPKNKSRRLIKILDSRSNSAKEISEAISLIEETGAVEYAENAAKKLVSVSSKRLQSVLPESRAKKLLNEFASYIIERKN